MVSFIFWFGHETRKFVETKGDFSCFRCWMKMDDFEKLNETVDGRNPAPPNMYETL